MKTNDYIFSIIHPHSNPYDWDTTGLELEGVEPDRGQNVDKLQNLVELLNPKIIIEVGSWRGSSAINMARKLDDSSCIICVDTWLGSLDFIENKDHSRYKQLKIKNGYPNVYYTFLTNVILSGVKDKVVPFPSTSWTAYQFLMQSGIKADLIYIDGSHDEKSVYEDISCYWNLLRDDKSLMCGDDLEFTFPGVEKAVNRFGTEKELEVELNEGFWIFKRK